MSQKAKEIEIEDPLLHNTMISEKLSDNLKERSYTEHMSDASSEEDVPRTKTKKHIQRFSDSDSDSSKENIKTVPQSNNDLEKPTLESSDDENYLEIFKSKPSKTRIQQNKSSDSENGSDNALKNEEQQWRMKNKRNKLKSKFKSLLSARGKEPSPNKIESELNKSDSTESDNEIHSIGEIKQQIKERISFKPSICDPDTSDGEDNSQRHIKQKNERKIKLTSPKPQRMTAKQAMENMQKIKSESNRMLREKEVSLPYHRPKALSLKDIMNRRRPALSSDGKALPIKMNEQQLKQYAQMLEERQKEMMELCKSESEEEGDTGNINDAKSELNNDNDQKIEEITTVNYKSAQLETTNYNDSSIIGVDSIDKDDKGLEVSENISVSMETDLNKEQDSESSMKLVYNDSVNSDDGKILEDTTESVSRQPLSAHVSPEKRNRDKDGETSEVLENTKTLAENSEESHLTPLYLDTEQSIVNTEQLGNNEINIESNNKSLNNKSNQENEIQRMDENDFSDDEINMGDIDSIIENAEIIRDIEDKNNSQILIRDRPLNVNPKLTGAPGMVIDLDDSEATPKKSGVELLKETFTYFAKLKTPDEIEREKEKKLKPGTQLKKLKQQLEEQIAEQRSLEWAKRLEDDEQQQKELKMLRGEESEDDIEKLDKLEAQIEKENNDEAEQSESDPEEEPIENDVEMKDNVRPRNAMLDDEAEESECDEQENEIEGDQKDDDEENDVNELEEDAVNGDDEDSDSDYDESESSESENEQPLKKGRILKAFEDSDDEDGKVEPAGEDVSKAVANTNITDEGLQSQVTSQDEVIQLAQRHKSASEDLFSQETLTDAKDKPMETSQNSENFTQTFSILESSKQTIVDDLNNSDKLSANDTQSLESNIDKGLYTLTESQKELPLPSQVPTFTSQSQPIGEDILALCTGQFYNNQFISQVEENPLTLGPSLNDVSLEKDITPTDDVREQDEITDRVKIAKDLDIKDDFIELNVKPDENVHKIVDDNLKSILDELDDPEFDQPKPNKFFTGGNKQSVTEQDNVVKKKLRIDSDDESKEQTDSKKLKKRKKKKAEKRALQISDDEESEQEIEYESDIEEEHPERIVEYDSEENEIEVKPEKWKKKRKTAEFFEKEAELTSEDEWVGSGDEDEAGLDRMEREEGDDDVFHQGALQAELGQIHMRDVLDQDKREVRIIQELLFEDGDLGAGGRQRKFRWKNIDGEEEMEIAPDLVDTQEEEYESEEQWRKQRHEREVYLREMRNKEDPEESLSVCVNRTAIIKASLSSKTMPRVIPQNSHEEKTDINHSDKKNARDILSPKKPLILMQQNYQGSLLSRGRGALARLAALATPLAADDDTKVGSLGPSSRRNFVFTANTPDEEPKITKRKAESNPGTPKLVKKMRIEEKNAPRNSLLDHLKV